MHACRDKALTAFDVLVDKALRTNCPVGGKKARFTRPSVPCRFEGRLRKSFSLHYAERAGRICRGVPKVSGSKAYDATPLPPRFAPQKRTLRLYNSIVACLPRVALRHERPSDSVGTKTTRSKKKGRTRRPLWPTRRDSNPKQCRRRALFHPIRLRIDILPVYCSTLRRVWQ